MCKTSEKPMNFRRVLKNMIKNAQKGHDGNKDLFVFIKLQNYGLISSYSELLWVLRNCKKIKGRHFLRLGKSAKKQNKSADLKTIALYYESGKDLRTVPFID